MFQFTSPYSQDYLFFLEISLYCAMKDRHEWLKLQYMSLFNEGYIREHTGQWPCHLA